MFLKTDQRASGCGSGMAKYEKLRARLYDLTDRELMDIGTSRGEIDHVAANRSIDPRGVRS
jgi:hypothetical protein